MKTRFDPTEYSLDYLDHIQENQSENTYQAKRTTISKFVAYCDQENIIIDLQDKNGATDDIYEFFKEGWLKPIPTYLSHIRDFLEFIGDEHGTEVYYEMDDLQDKLKNKRLPDWEKSHGQHQPEWLSDEEIEAACEATDELGELIIRTLYETGCRRGEVAAWKPSDVNWNPGGGLGAAVSVERTMQKTGTVKLSPKTDLGYRVVELTSETANMLRSYIEENDVDSEGFIFNGNTSLLYRKVKQAFTEANVKLDDSGTTKVTPHWMRHNRNTRLRKNPNISEADREQYIGNDMPKAYTQVDHEEVQGVLTR